MQKRNGDKISPCQTPKVQLKRHDDPSLVVILDLIYWYRLYIILKHLPFILLSNILYQGQTVANACLKSMKQQNIFFFLALTMSIRHFIMNRSSVVE